MIPRMGRALYLVFVAMVMFTIGVIVFVAANDTEERLLGAATVLGSIAVILTNMADDGGGHDR